MMNEKSEVKAPRRYREDKYTIEEHNAYDAIKDIKNDRFCSYKSKLEELLEALGYSYSFSSEGEAKIILMAMISRCYDMSEEGFNRAYIALGLMKGYPHRETIGDRRAKYAEVINTSAECIRKSEDVIFMNIIHQTKKDAEAYGDIRGLLKELKELAIDTKIVELKDDKRFNIVFPSLEIQN